MIAYLLYSSISLALLLFIYRVFLEKEKRFVFNRVFLLWSLLFSFTIPLLPTGLITIDMPWSKLQSSGETESVANYQLIDGLVMDSEMSSTAVDHNTGLFTSDTLITIAYFLYGSITILLFIRLILIIDRIQLTARRNPKRIYLGYEIVLVKENVVPHSFINTVLLNKEQFNSGKIPEEVLFHEITHVRQKHSLDILFVEFLKILFWFNPLLYLYKHDIALNHEYLADEAVLSKGTAIKNYQQMLLKSLQSNTLHTLASSFNFSLTKRRLQMMNQSKTKVRFLIKLAILAPLFAGLSLMLGCEPASNENTPDIDSDYEMSIEVLSDNALIVNEKNMTLDELKNLLLELPESPGLVSMKVSPDAEFGVITDVQNTLRKHKAYKINYSSTKSDDSSMNLVLPPVPNTRIEDQNIIQILMNSDGKILMNQGPVNLNEVRKKIKQFEKKHDAESAETIVSIKTLPDTPYEQYLELLNEVRIAYDELRNQAAQNKYGMNFSSLDDNSSEKEKIRKMYPGKLSVIPPESNLVLDLPN